MRATDRDVTSLYRQPEWVEAYDEKRFMNAGGRHIHALEIDIVRRAFHPLSPDSSVLDVASGTGRFALFLARQGHRITAVDASRAMLDQLKQKADDAGLALTLVESDVRAMPFDAEQFDAACCFRLLWHYDDWQPLLQSIMRCAKGPVVFDLMNRRSLRRIVRPLALRKAYEAHTTKEDVEAWCRKSGYTMLAEEQAFAFPFIIYLKLPFLVKVLRPIDEWLSRRGWGSMLYFTVMKGT